MGQTFDIWPGSGLSPPGRGNPELTTLHRIMEMRNWVILKHLPSEKCSQAYLNVPDKASVPVKPDARLSVKANVFTLKLGNIVLWFLIVEADKALNRRCRAVSQPFISAA